MNTKTTTQSQTTQKAYQREIEGLSFLKNFQGELVEIDFINTEGVCKVEYNENLLVIDSTKYITLGSELKGVKIIRLLKEQILDIDELNSNQISVLTISGEYIISKI